MISPMGRKRQANFSLPPRMHLKSGTYYYVTNEKPRKWISLGKDLGKAKVEWARLESETLSQDSISVLIDEWLSTEDFKTRPLSTQTVYRNIANQLKDVFTCMSVSDITPGDVAKWMDSHASKNQANMGRAVLSNVLSIAVRYGLIMFNPAKEIGRHKVEGRKRYITDAEFIAIRNHASPMLRAAMDVSYVTGARISDVVAISLSAWTSEGLLIRQIKTGKLQQFKRTPELEKVIDAAKKVKRPIRSLYLFCDSSGQQCKTSVLRYWWNKARTDAGVKDVHFHDIRGKSATEAEIDGQDYQALLGHASKAMSDKYLKVEKAQVVEPRRKSL